MSRFELDSKLVLRDTRTGKTATLSNKTYHLVDERMDPSVMDSFIENLGAGIVVDESDGYFEDFSRVMEFVSVLAVLIKEYKLPKYIEPPLNNSFDLECDILDKYTNPPKFLN